jgi:hypothetical protein
VIVCGVTFISFLIAIVTSLFIDANRANEHEAAQERHDRVVALLRTMRLATLGQGAGKRDART